jgi:hypothetical protein
MTAQSDSSPVDLNTRLAQALRFGTEDRAANLEGRLSEAQIAFLDSQSRADRRNRFLTAAFFGAIGVFFTLTANDFLNVVLFALVVGAIVNLALRDWRLVRADLDERTVDSVEGALARPSKRSLSAMFQEPSLVKIGEGSYHLATDVQKAFEGGRTYRFFYTPHARLILGAETVDELLGEPDHEVDMDAAEDADQDAAQAEAG